MAVTYKVLGQSKPAAATATTLYTVPTGAGNYAVISTLTVCNPSGNSDEIRVSVRPAGAAQEDKHYILYGIGIGPYQTQFFTIGITAASTDVITVYSVGGYSNFNIFGSENA